MAGGGETKDFNWLKHVSKGNGSCQGIEVNDIDEEALYLQIESIMLQMAHPREKNWKMCMSA